ncbi:MAG: SatD family protein [Clostridium sp.]|nr:SatD family protein [Clostridium sp.]
MYYCAILCDIKSSRKIENRTEIQYKLIKMLEIANEKFKSDIAWSFNITTGDEWEGLLKYPSNYNKILKFFRCYMPEIKFYTGIGIDKILICDFNLSVNELDGPAFYSARKAVNFAKRNNLPLVLLSKTLENF